jgi:hypothetical protein
MTSHRITILTAPGSPRLACPIDVWLYTVVTA